jgi:type VI secretion system protein
MYDRRQWFFHWSSILCKGAYVLWLAAALGCGTGSRSLFGGDVGVKVEAEPGINQDSPVPVELVVVFDKDLLSQLTGMTARDWFQKREQIRKDHPGDDELVSMSWEVVPGQSLPEASLSFGSGARGGLVFADYFADGAHRARVDPHQNLKIRLLADDVAVEQTP